MELLKAPNIISVFSSASISQTRISTFRKLSYNKNQSRRITCCCGLKVTSSSSSSSSVVVTKDDFVDEEDFIKAGGSE
ncbi:hypothetical protein ACJBZ2_11185, partial [Streptococcus suis]